MTGGKIFDWYVKGGLTEFLVKDGSDFCCVTAKIPEQNLKEIKQNRNIWWQSSDLFISLFGVIETRFEKVGVSGGGVKEFYARYYSK